ncbi:MAG: aspartate-semialdehyde dehydrogenase [Chitinophagales bacterium]|nr:aspartate-semialdehyde dehydrogenase [Bacteroidota bacterium]MCB9042458.1 aspartate-semialdehyde dehydrogenase [Chitinophagales bacterium]
MKVAVVGATGMVGRVMLAVLEERNFPVTELIPVSSPASVGKPITFKGKTYTICSMDEAISRRPEVAIFSAGGSVSLENAPRFAEVGTTVIDNSSAWRMQPDKKLIVPEINAHTLTKDDKIIANPNCSTIQMVVALNPLYHRYGIERLVISTYQSVTGTGKNAVEQMYAERAGREAQMVYKYPIDLNCIPHCDVFLDNGYTKEEMKLVHETRKILGDDSLKITATAVRVPVVGGHSEAVNVYFKQEYDLAELRQLLEKAPGLTVLDNTAEFQYPMPLIAEGKDTVWVGRLRRDESQERTLNMWIVADNLRKGAATNAIQIAEYLLEKGML